MHHGEGRGRGCGHDCCFEAPWDVCSQGVELSLIVLTGHLDLVLVRGVATTRPW